MNEELLKQEVEELLEEFLQDTYISEDKSLRVTRSCIKDFQSIFGLPVFAIRIGIGSNTIYSLSILNLDQPDNIVLLREPNIKEFTFKAVYEQLHYFYYQTTMGIAEMAANAEKAALNACIDCRTIYRKNERGL